MEIFIMKIEVLAICDTSFFNAKAWQFLRDI